MELETPRRAKKRKFERRSKAHVRPLELTPRVDRILRVLHEYRVATTRQLGDLLAAEGYSRQRTERLLSALYDHKYLDMPEAQVYVRPRLGRGGRPNIYALGDLGAARLEAAFGMPRGSARFRAKNRELGRPYLEHTLLTTEIMLAFERTVARRGDVRLIYPREVLARAPEATQNARRPFEWIVKATWEGTELRIPVTPDFKLFGVEFRSLPQGQNRVYFALEADTGTETNIPEDLTNPKRTSLFRKYLGYFATYRNRYHQERFGIHAFRVLTVTARNGVQVVRDPKTKHLIERTRVENLQAAARRASRNEEPLFFLFTDLAALQAAEDVLQLPWATACRDKTAILDITLKRASS